MIHRAHQCKKQSKGAKNQVKGPFYHFLFKTSLKDFQLITVNFLFTNQVIFANNQPCRNSSEALSQPNHVIHIELEE
uniref:Putative ovule protein n=1 Tax=Solanum chacoense TaxID=4108 RepID=A0A0V0GTD0_SOLCH